MLRPRQGPAPASRGAGDLEVAGAHRGTEEISLDEAAGHFLAEAIASPRPIPAHDNAAVDGYAFTHSAYDQKEGARLKIVGEAAAGHPFKQTPPPNSAVRIFTGAVMPVGFDTVAMQEDVRIAQSGEARWAVVPPGLKPGITDITQLGNCLNEWRARRDFELLTPRFVVWCSIQLSYGRVLPLWARA